MSVMSKLKDVLERAEAWPPEAQQELAEIALEIEASVSGGAYQASEEELKALDQAERSGIASDQQVQAAFRAFRRA
jgi:hypothetical protein